MTKCTRRHLSSADAGTLLRRALLTTTSPPSQHPTEHLLSVALTAATAIVHAYPPPTVDLLTAPGREPAKGAALPPFPSPSAQRQCQSRPRHLQELDPKGAR